MSNLAVLRLGAMRRLTPLAALALVLATVALQLSVAPARDPGRPPNVVVIFTDDQTVGDMRVMPRTRRLLGTRGVTFTNSFVSYPLCCPSRATYLTGQYAHNHGVWGNRPPLGGYGRLREAHVLPVWLQRAGYVTGHVGKYLNGYGVAGDPPVPPGWSDWRGSVDPSTYRMWGFTLSENGVLTSYGDPLSEDPGLYGTDVFRGRALEFIRSYAGGEDPFFLSLSFLAPHSESSRSRPPTLGRVGETIRPAPRHEDAFRATPLPRPPSFNERDLSDKPAFLQRQAPPLTAPQVARITESYRDRRASLLAVDEAVGAIVRTLAELGELRRTWIVFTSDNGYFHGEHRIAAGKVMAYEPATRVPLIISGPALAGGAVSRQLVANIDLAPTVLDIANASPDRPLDGTSLLAFAQRPRRHVNRTLLHETGIPGGDPGADTVIFRDVAVPTYQGVRTARYVYLEYADGSRELYDLARDPHELRSRHEDLRYAATRTALQRELQRLRRCHGSSCRKPAARIPPPAQSLAPLPARR
jgi:N-acetylglucosamine-6-sulfatase